MLGMRGLGSEADGGQCSGVVGVITLIILEENVSLFRVICERQRR